MTMQILNGSSDAYSYYFEIWLDTTKTDSTGNPDPTYVKTYAFNMSVPAWFTGTQDDWMNRCLGVAKVQAQADYSSIVNLQTPQGTTPISGLSGQTFTQ